MTGERALSHRTSRAGFTIQFGRCGACGDEVSLLVTSGRVRRHRRNGQDCPGSLHAPARPERKNP